MNQNNHSLPLKNKQRGMFSIDTMGAIAIALVIMGVIAATFFVLKMKSKTTTAMNDLNILQINTTSLKMANGGYGTGTLLSALNTAKLLPSNMVRSGTSTVTLQDVWGGNADVIGAGPNFEIHFDGVPTSDCMQVLPRTIEGGTYSQIMVGSTALDSTSTNLDVQNACSSGTANKVDVVWTVQD